MDVLSLGLEGFDNVALHIDARGQQRATKPATGINEGDVFEFRDSKMVRMPASKHSLEAIEGL